VKSAISTALQARLTAVQARIAAAETAMLEATASGVSSFELDTGEADQKVVFKSVQKMQKYIDSLYATEEWLIRRLTGCGIVSVRVRRKP
jgi:hypothetical protein